MEKKIIDAVLRPLSKKTTQIYGYKETINSISQSKIEFYSSSLSNERVKHLQDLCDNSNIWDQDCSNTIEEIENSLIAKSVFVIKDHHFYEGIQKYDMFFAGWDDNDSVVVVTKEHNDKNATSPNQTTYRSLWSDYNKIKTLAGNGGKFMLSQINGGLEFIKNFDDLFAIIPDKEVVPQELYDLIDKREKARLKQDWKTADKIRNLLHKEGWLVEDSPSGPKVKPKK